jgi:cation transport regulator ChaB
LGDSFTSGVGSPLEHTWPQILQQRVGTRTINVSLDGASNQWIARKAQSILSSVQPQVLVIQWSYVWRREESAEKILEDQWQNFYSNVKDPAWPAVSYRQKHTLPEFIQQELRDLHNYDLYKTAIETATDEDRRINVVRETTEQDIENTIQCVQSLANWESHTTIVHSFVPGFVNATHTQQFFNRIQNTVKYCIPSFPVLDLARDGHHYGKLTASGFVDAVVQKIKNKYSFGIQQ